MSGNPLAEVFGFPIENVSKKAKRFREKRLCPYNNIVPSCTKDKVDSPLGVCSVLDTKGIAITCPVRFREEWIILDEAAEFFFKKGSKFVALSEIRLEDRNGKSAGNIDVVLISYDEKTGDIIDFGAIEVQAVYISGNVRRPFEAYMESPNPDFIWDGRNYPHADYLSSSRKRLVPQLLYKGGIFKVWKKKTAVVLHTTFFNTLPKISEVEENQADIVWLIYDLVLDDKAKKYELKISKKLFTKFDDSMSELCNPEAGDVNVFIEKLKTKLSNKLSSGVTLEEALKSDSSIEEEI